MRNFLATLLLSQGVPMLCGGDEIGRTQQGNNNAYCQDNAISWFDWTLDDRAGCLLAFTRQLIHLRRRHPEFRRRKFFQGRPLCDAEMKDLVWIRPDGGEMSEAEWRASTLRVFGFRLCGDAMDDVDEQGQPITGDTWLTLLNAHPSDVGFILPEAHPGVAWEVVVDTTRAGEPRPPERRDVGQSVSLPARSLQLFRAWQP
jgi:glycogen operon protein